MPQATRSDSFISSFAKQAQIGEYALRPISACSHYILKHLENGFLKGVQDLNPESPEVQYALMEFIYVHAAPEDEVAEAIDIDRKQWKKRVLRFGMTIPISALEDAQDPITKQATAATALACEPQPDGESDLDPNGSRQTA